MELQLRIGLEVNEQPIRPYVAGSDIVVTRTQGVPADSISQFVALPFLDTAAQPNWRWV
ncbi:hypothetical protein VMCG_02813 [Cytospora schulzeri]|uniref:Uncharacterized protein n=1 Tax=Cytospora schulzeri TaxID=448051 RepID=A0A423WZW9_9PEZI|nr:hypothetical protein VMCG_02813 [Valsa malicola]